MLEVGKAIKNPLTVIAIFAGTTEVMGIYVLPNFSESNQSTFLWFLIVFPLLLVCLFFLTLNFNHRVLYAPSDYRADSSFLAASKIEKSHITEETREEEGANKGISFGSINHKDAKSLP